MADADTTEPQVQEEIIDTTEYDNDPMIVAMLEGEAEIKAQQDNNQVEKPEEKPEEPEKQPEAAKPQSPDTQDNGTMIPKARLDEVLREKERIKEHAIYLQGQLDAKTSGAAAPQQAPEQQKPDPVEDIKAKIVASEDKKIDLAAQYENGDISLVDYQTEVIKIDREIRGLHEQNSSAIIANAQKIAQETVDRAQAELIANQTALDLQNRHPYIAEIDSLPEAERNEIWANIRARAEINVKARGIQPFIRGVESPEYIAEIAGLTDKYGPLYTGKQLDNSGLKPAPVTEADTKAQRQAKIELSRSQPPSMAGAAAGVPQQGLSESDIEKMSDDQIADLHDKAPELLYRAAKMK